MTPLAKTKLVTGLLLATLLTGCKNFHGQIEFAQDATFNSGRKKQLFVPKGLYAVKVSMISKTKVKLVLPALPGENSEYSNESRRRKRKKKKKHVIKFNIPKNSINVHSEFEISPEISGQPYKLQGKITDESSSSEIYSSTESCNIVEREYECWWDRELERRVCDEFERVIPGYKDVEYYNHYTRQILKAELINPNDYSQVASLNTVYSNSEKIYTYRGNCYRAYN